MSETNKRFFHFEDNGDDTCTLTTNFDPDQGEQTFVVEVDFSAFLNEMIPKPGVVEIAMEVADKMTEIPNDLG